MVRVKICGITNIEDALLCVSEGVSALGFNFYRKSPRYIDPEKAYDIIKELPPFISSIGLFVNEQKETVENNINITGINTLQFHGDESAQYCSFFKTKKVIKALRIKDKNDLERISEYNVSGYLLDSYHPELYGGTGLPFPWELLDSLNIKDNIIVAGGINPGNVANLLQNIMPYGIDICSGVEKSPGIKDKNKIKELMKVVSLRKF